MLEPPRLLAWVHHWEWCEVFNDPLEDICTCGLRAELEELGFSEEDVDEARDEAERCQGC